MKVFTGKVPFPNMTNGLVVVQILNRKRPVKPPATKQLGLTTEMWSSSGMLVCRPLQATSHGRSSHDMGRVYQWVCCSLFPVMSISQHITSRPSTSTLVLKSWEHQSSLQNSPRHVVSDPGFGAPIVVLNWFVGEQGSCNTSHGFVVFHSSLPPHWTGSHLCLLPLICRGLSPFHFIPNSLLFISN